MSAPSFPSVRSWFKSWFRFWVPIHLLLLCALNWISSSASAAAVPFSQVKPLLDRCASCHAHYRYPVIADFSALPLGGGSDEEHAYWIKRIAYRMNLSNRGAAPTMPPAWAWEADAEEIERLTRWIREGAQDDAGRPTITDAQIRAFLGVGATQN